MNKLILLRHGQSQWNLENKFTGWQNVPLTKKGELEAKKAGELIKKNKIHIDYVFSSVLERANKTAEIALKEADLKNLWENDKLLMTRDENLNERDYGDLVGLNKQETSEKFGKEQVHIWRRSFDIPPPGGESLKDTAERVLPYFHSEILPKAEEGLDVLVAAHGNSLRALVMELEGISSDEIVKLEIATGDPLTYELTEGKITRTN